MSDPPFRKVCTAELLLSTWGVPGAGFELADTIDQPHDLTARKRHHYDVRRRRCSLSTALLEFLIGVAAGCQVARAVGVESELGLVYAGLRQLCSPSMDRIDKLPAPQREAFGTAIGL